VIGILAGAVALGENLLGRAEVVFEAGSLTGEFRATAVATIKLTIDVIILGVTVLVKLQVMVLTFQFNFGIQALALGAVGVVVIFGGSAAVATIPIATAVVIFVVTPLVAFPVRLVAFFATGNALVFRVHATAFGAVLEIRLFAAAISSIPVTATVVVVVVTVAVPTPGKHFAFTVARVPYTWVFALAFLAIGILQLCALFRMSATVSAVPIAATVVVVVVTVAVALPLMHGAVFHAVVRVDVLLIQAGADVTIVIIVFGSTAVSSVPVAAAVVVAIVAPLVAFPSKHLA